MTDDVLELLLPDAGDRQRALGARWAMFLRLLRDDARGGSAPRVALDPQRAVGDLEEHARAEVRAVIEDLLRHHLHALLDEDAYLWFGDPRLDHAAAWSALEVRRLVLGGLPQVPMPGETPLAVAARLVAALAQAGSDRFRVRLWELRFELLRGAPGAEEVALQELDRAAESGCGPGFRAELAADVAALALDRCDVVSARDRLARVGGECANSARARQLARWCAALLGAPCEAGTHDPGAGPVPRPLVELRADLPTLLASFPGPARAPGCAVELAVRVVDELGGRGVGGGDGASPGRVEWVTFSGAARDPVAARLWAREGEPENDLLRRGEVVLRRAGPGDSAPCGARAAETRTVALAPAFGTSGELHGWLRCEWPHALAPSRAALTRCAMRIARSRMGAGREEPTLASVRGRPATPTAPSRSHEGDDRLRAFFEELVRGLDLKLRHRRWSALLERGPDPGSTLGDSAGGDGLGSDETGSDGTGPASGWCVVAAGGGGLSGSAPGGRGALACARAAHASVRVEAPAPERTLSAAAASALVLPLELEGRPVGMLVFESTRRRDFRAADEARLTAALAARALHVRLADLDAWHRRRFGGEYVAVPDAPSCARRARRVLGIARARGPVTIVGPAGAGKRLLARWLHFEGRAGRDAAFARFEAPLGSDAPFGVGAPTGSEVSFVGAPGTNATAPGRAGVRREDERLGPSAAWPAKAGTVLVAHLERFGRRDQARLLERLESAGSGSSRVVVTLPDSPLRLAEQGHLAPALARRLERAVLALPGLAARRDELATLVPAVLRRVCAEEGIEPPRLRDDAVACLWRQGWPGNWVELENVLCKVALDREGEEVGERELRATLEVYGVELLKRLPSRHPSREDVTAALRVTRRETGRWNKRRAAQYLGWDPDTLVARMRDHAIDPEGLVE